MIDRTEEAIPGIAETWSDEFVHVEFAIERGDVQGNVRVLLKHPLHTLWCGNDPNEFDLTGAARFEFAGRGRGRTGGGEHRIEQYEEVTGEMIWEAVVVADRVVRRFVSVDPDVVDGGLREEDARAVGHAESGSEDGDESDFGGDFAPLRGFEWSPIGDCPHREVGGCLVEQQHGQFVDEIAEMEGVGSFVRQNPHFVVRQWMRTDVKIGELARSR